MMGKVLTLVTEVHLLFFKLVGYSAVDMYYCTGHTLQQQLF